MIHLLIWLIALAIAFLTLIFRLICFVASDKNTIVIGSWRAVNFMNLPGTPMQRAAWSVFGIVNVKKEEILYFIAAKDQSGQALDGQQHYRLTGTNLDARFWSVSLYNKKGQLIENPTHQYSLSNQQIAFDDNNNFVLHVAPDKKVENWLPTGNESSIQLLIRLYQPSVETLQNPMNIPLPAIQKA